MVRKQEGKVVLKHINLHSRLYRDLVEDDMKLVKNYKVFNVKILNGAD